jgi:hypothetical protein
MWVIAGNCKYYPYLDKYWQVSTAVVCLAAFQIMLMVPIIWNTTVYIGTGRSHAAVHLGLVMEQEMAPSGTIFQQWEAVHQISHIVLCET